MSYDLIVMGCSLGGLQATCRILADLDRQQTTPIILIQHRHRTTGSMLGRTLQKNTSLRVQDADDKMPIEPGNLYMAPVGYHLLVDGHSIALSTELPVHHAQPSIDVAFDSAARSYKERLIGIVMTSSSADGAQGAQTIEDRGGCVIIQSPDTAENPTLAQAAMAATKKAKIVPLAEIGAVLRQLCPCEGIADQVRRS